MAGTTYTSDVNGQVALPEGTLNAEWSLDVVADGFLPRRSTIGGSPGRHVSLWPSANDAEADDVRQMVYRRGHPAGEVFDPTARGEVIRLKMPTGTPVSVLAAWAEAARLVGTQFELDYSFDPQPYGDIYTIVVTEGTPCGGLSDVCIGRFETATRTLPVSVSPARFSDSLTARRALVSWFLGPHVSPGLMSTASPREELSALEAQTIAVMLTHGRRTRWPDDDR